jgi:tRNA dimethylallyltransferase
MHYPDSHPPLIVILGPTAVGKTSLSIQLAERVGGEIVSADSRLFYRGMDIGTAKPTVEERKLIPHHLIDVADPDDIWSLGRYKKAALGIISDIHSRKKIPILVGGTGQYIRAITEGWVVPKLKSDLYLREVLLKWVDQIGVNGLHSRLETIDPRAASKIAPNNVRRTIRALEVIFHTGNRFSELRRREPVPYLIVQIGLSRPREALYQRIDKRVDAMIEAGFVDEVARLLEKGYSPNLPSLSAIGYKQIIAFLNGEMTLEDAVVSIKQMTRQLVRRQANWFKYSDPEIIWLEVNPDAVFQLEEIIGKKAEDPNLS